MDEINKEIIDNIHNFSPRLAAVGVVVSMGVGLAVRYIDLDSLYLLTDVQIPKIYMQLVQLFAWIVSIMFGVFGSISLFRQLFNKKPPTN